MVNGVFGAAGYRASLEGGDPQKNASDSVHPDHSAHGGTGSQVEQADQMVSEGGHIYGAEPIPREMTAGQRSASARASAGAGGVSGPASTARPTSPVRVGRVGSSDLYVTHDLTFDLSPSQPTIEDLQAESTASPVSDRGDVFRAQRVRAGQGESPEIRTLLGMYRFTRPSERAQEFVRQAAYMESYEPQGAFDASFHAFYPVYSDMTVRQLNGYFAWRTRVRNGEYPLTSSSAAFVYIYELINGIGVKDPMDAYNALKRFRKNYADKYDPAMWSYLDEWMRDLIVVYDLGGKPRDEQFAVQMAADRVYEVLSNPADFSEREIADSVLALGKYRYEKSPLNRPIAMAAADNDEGTGARDAGTEDQDDRGRGMGPRPAVTLWQRAVAAAWKALLVSHVAAKGYFASRVATWKMVPITLFRRAVWYDADLAEHPYEVRHVRIDGAREYTRENGHWYAGYYQAVAGQGSSMKSLLHEIDRIGREVWHAGRPLKPRGFYPPYSQVIASALKKLKTTIDREEWDAAHPPVRVDLSKLAQIREAAAGTRESLLTQEEREAEADEARREEEQQSESDQSRPNELRMASKSDLGQKSGNRGSNSQESDDAAEPLSTTPAEQDPEGAQQEADAADDAASLTDDELFLLRALVADPPAAGWKHELLLRHALPSVLADSINDKLFDLVGDSVLETDENGDPCVVDDYRPDITDFLNRIASGNESGDKKQ